MIINLIKKKHVDRILKLLYESNELYFGQLTSILGIDTGNLSKILNEMYKLGLLKKREEKTEYKLPRTYYSLTEKGLKLIKLYIEIENLDNTNCENKNIIDNSKNKVINNSGIVIGDTKDSNITIKK
ncbi:DNA-binding HxlR family transcriptional regulator [Methanococcus voltae]|uniref:DNA-binding HxlR family transcriptional regulator n=2 Tax=Methanococcus voltae TaxID=2188 RepID=A0A8J7UT30_METVO|nr:winged helix-turn-helix domain-containing protein [Methanococcus voltae]MBP2202182.1 DNA-binding HxlR family transcriptional regulator [Methanococcus voltae]MCS3922571.1 DNA-binding HxlR family transcriptional regulator [Methanococcus voltae PS]